MKNTIDVDGLKNLAFGFGISAAGGGGSFVQGVQIVKSLIDNGFKSIRLEDMKSLTEFSAVVSGGIGKPSALTDVMTFSARMEAVVNQYKKEAKVQDNLGLATIEAGPINGFLPIAVAYNNQYILFDCDGAGRAVPSLTTLMYDDTSSVSPLAYAWKVENSGEDINTYLTTAGKGKFQGGEAEAFFSSVMGIGTDPAHPDDDANGAIPFVCWGFNKNTIPDIPTGSLSLRMFQGYEYRYGLMNNKFCPWEFHFQLMAQTPKEELNCKDYQDLFFESTIDGVTMIPNGRWNCGWMTFDRTSSSEKRLYFVNEFSALVEVESPASTSRTFKVLATGPSIIYALFKDDAPDPVVTQTLGVSAGSWLPYNTGDIEKIKELSKIKAKIAIGVIGATPGSDAEPLLMKNKADNFIAVIRQTFDVLRKTKGFENQFPSDRQVSQIVPNPYGHVSQQGETERLSLAPILKSSG